MFPSFPTPLKFKKLFFFFKSTDNCQILSGSQVRDITSLKINNDFKKTKSQHRKNTEACLMKTEASKTPRYRFKVYQIEF